MDISPFELGNIFVNSIKKDSLVTISGFWNPFTPSQNSESKTVDSNGLEIIRNVCIPVARRIESMYKSFSEVSFRKFISKEIDGSVQFGFCIDDDDNISDDFSEDDCINLIMFYILKKEKDLIDKRFRIETCKSNFTTDEGDCFFDSSEGHSTGFNYVVKLSGGKYDLEFSFEDFCSSCWERYAYCQCDEDEEEEEECDECGYSLSECECCGDCLSHPCECEEEEEEEEEDDDSCPVCGWDEEDCNCKDEDDEEEDEDEQEEEIHVLHVDGVQKVVIVKKEKEKE